MSTVLGILLIAIPAGFVVYAYVIYPALLHLLRMPGSGGPGGADPGTWPSITIAVPAYNEARSIATTLDSLLSLDYPADRRQIVIMSDASTDETDDIVRAYAERGVELVRMPHRMGKMQMENVAARHFRGEIVVNTDATIRIAPGSLKALIRVFQDPTLGCASGRDISVGRESQESNQGESGYVGYEMWLRDLETRAGGIIGASGCFYAIRRHLVDEEFPAALSRDFAAPLQTRLAGLRTVSVRNAVCLVPRTVSLRAEYRRKVRTMTRGLQTIFAYRRLLNPIAYGRFAWMLWSHKLARWLVFLTLPLVLPGLWLLFPRPWMAGLLLAGSAAAAIAALIVLRWPADRPMPSVLALPGFAVLTCAAGFQSWMRALAGRNDVIWEPTRR